jgi:hypothetical protein
MSRVFPFRPRRTTVAGALVLAAFVLPSLIALPSVAEQPESKLDSLQKAWKKRQGAAKTLDVSWHSSRSLLRSYAQTLAGVASTPGQAAPNDFLTFGAKLRFVIDAAGRTRLEHTGQVPAPGTGEPTAEESVEVTADDLQKMFFAVGGTGFPAYHEKPEPRITEQSGQPGPKIVDGRLLPLLLALRAVDPQRPVLDIGSLAETGQEFQFDDCKCLVFKHSRGEVWVDPLRGYVPVRYLEMMKNRKTRDIVIRYAAQAAVGWIPVSWNHVKLAPQTGAVLESLVAEDVRWQVNPDLTPGTFKIELPVGTWVNKHPAKEGEPGETYLLRKDGKRSILPGEFDGGNYQELLSTDPAGGGARTATVIVLCLLGVVAVALLVMSWFRRARAPENR